MDPLSKSLVGGFFLIAGLVMLIFRRDVKAFHEDLFAGLIRAFPLFIHGRAVTVFVIVFGVLSIIGGGLVVLLALPFLN